MAARRSTGESSDAMPSWFQKTHGLPFKGFLIEWRLM